MEHSAISVKYDLGTPVTTEYSLNIIRALSNSGVHFDINPSEDHQVYLIVDGSVYTPFFIEKHSKDVLSHVMKVEEMVRQKRSDLGLISA